jgi:MFS transporter, putative metabolite:H+ symporter
VASIPQLDAPKRLNRRQSLIAVVGIVNGTLEFFDQYVIAFVLLFILKPWQLTYGQTAIVLLSSGIGSMFGALFWGWLADRYGRKPALVLILSVLSLSSLFLAFTPDRGWIYLSLFRMGVGFGVGGYAVILTLVQEFMPASKRAFIGGTISISSSFGLLLASLVTATLAASIGWRGMFVVGALPVFFTLVIAKIIPESPRWALAKGREKVAIAAAAWTLQIDSKDVVIEDRTMPAGKSVQRGSIFDYKRNLVVSTLISLGVVTGYYGLFLWGPTLLAQVQGLTSKEASHVMLGAGVLGIVSRVLFSWLAEKWGRRPAGIVCAIASATCMAAAGAVAGGHIGSPALFFAFFLATCFFCDANLAISGPYTTEIWPAKVRAAGAGWGYGTGGVGKILGPLGLALIVGSSDVLNPKATVAAALPAFLFLGVCLLLTASTYVFAKETRAVSLEDLEHDLESEHLPHDERRAAMMPR